MKFLIEIIVAFGKMRFCVFDSLSLPLRGQLTVWGGKIIKLETNR